MTTLQTNQSKKSILLIAGINDRATKKLEFIGDLESTIKNYIEQSGSDFYGFLELSKNSLRTNTQLFGSVPRTRIINMVLDDKVLTSRFNLMSVPLHDDPKPLQLLGHQLDFVLNPEEYEIHICGLDLDQHFVTIVEDLISKGYKVTLYKDLIKSFKTNRESLNNIRSPLFRSTFAYKHKR